MKELSINEKMDMARHASFLSENPAFTFAVNYLREGCYERLRECPLKDKEGLTLIAQQLKVVDSLEAAIHSLIENGKLAASEWERLSKARTDGHIQRALSRIT